MASHPHIVGLILAGGRSTRMGGKDKSFALLDGHPLLEHVIERLRPQVDAVAISSNAPPERFAAYGLPVLPDVLPGFQGPLAGIHAGMVAYPESAIAAVAVDLPFLPHDLVARLRAARRHGRCTYASDGKRHALALLCPPGMAPTLEAALRAGEARIGGWLARHGDAVAFSGTDAADLDFNINEPADLAQAETRVTRRR